MVSHSDVTVSVGVVVDGESVVAGESVVLLNPQNTALLWGVL